MQYNVYYTIIKFDKYRSIGNKLIKFTDMVWTFKEYPKIKMVSNSPT